MENVTDSLIMPQTRELITICEFKRLTSEVFNPYKMSKLTLI